MPFKWEEHPKKLSGDETIAPLKTCILTLVVESFSFSALTRNVFKEEPQMVDNVFPPAGQGGQSAALGLVLVE